VELPVIVYILPPIVIAMLIFSVVMRRRGLAQTQHATLGALASRLGLAVHEGDPTLNLYYLSQPTGNYTRSLRLGGVPYGHQTEFDFTDGSRTQDFLVLVRTTHAWGCYLVVRVGIAFAEFEVSLRQPPQYLEPNTMLPHLPEITSGNPQIDAIYRIASPDPRLGPVLAVALPQLDGKGYVHIVGQGNAVMIPVTRFGLSYFVHDAEAYLYVLETIASHLEGKAPPPFRAAPTPTP
jgi:hypothetical protein